MNRQPPISTLVPYTSIFRSKTLRRWCVPRVHRPPSRPRQQQDGRRHCNEGDWEQSHEPGGQRVVAMKEEERSEVHTSELQSRQYVVCRLLLEKKNEVFDRVP